LARISAIVWMALLTWRSPPRLRRWRTVLPEEAGRGAVRVAAGERCFVLEAGRVGGKQLGGRDRSNAGLVEQGTVERADELCEIVLVAFGFDCQRAGACREVAHDTEHCAFFDVAAGPRAH
jgi:hypothetical protein